MHNYTNFREVTIEVLKSSFSYWGTHQDVPAEIVVKEDNCEDWWSDLTDEEVMNLANIQLSPDQLW